MVGYAFTNPAFASPWAWPRQIFLNPPGALGTIRPLAAAGGAPGTGRTNPLDRQNEEGAEALSKIRFGRSAAV